jgi:diguanylate cyclase (GGDEF)-like protein/PAS domain S-box-containing protein
MRAGGELRMPIIVIVDDQPTNRKIFSKLASSVSTDVTVRSFGDPIDALAWLRTSTPDLIITDYKMPGINGAEFIRRFRQFPGATEVPVIVITIYEERSFRLRALEAGATDFLQSPVDHSEFLTRARNLLQLRKQQLLLASYAQSLERKLEDSEQALRDSSERLAQVIDTVPAMINATDRDGNFIFINAFQMSIAGADPASVTNQNAATLLGDEYAARHRALDRKVFETDAVLPSFEEEIVDRAGTRRVFLTMKSPLRDRSNVVNAVLTSSIDITDRKYAEAHLIYMAHHDPLTDLPNRALLRDRLRRHIGRARRGDCGFALHFIDLDGFKAINDLLGHSAGDKFLKTVAQRLLSISGPRDTVARLGGDEFAILQSDTTGTDDAAHLAKRIIEAVAESQCLHGERVTCTASIGITLHPNDGSDVHTLLKNADLAMYRAKADGRNLYRFYAKDMQTRAREAAHLDGALRTAIEEKQFVLYFQPIVAMKSGRVVGAEALLRWRRPDRGIIGPSEFLPRAEENGMILPINEWVLREACREAKSWQRFGLPPIRVSVNISPVEFHNRNVPLIITKVLGETGLEPWRLDLELTENIVLQNAAATATDLQNLRALGVSISIDDFGTGYSSLTYIKQLPITQLKIDQCFVRNLPTDPNDAAIVRAIVSLGHSLDLKVIAEGVETLEQLQFLRAEGCDEMQGYYFAKPMPAENFVAFARSQPMLALTA